jgi:hypothetical protein
LDVCGLQHQAGPFFLLHIWAKSEALQVLVQVDRQQAL